MTDIFNVINENIFEFENNLKELNRCKTFIINNELLKCIDKNIKGTNLEYNLFFDDHNEGFTYKEIVFSLTYNNDRFCFAYELFCLTEKIFLEELKGLIEYDDKDKQFNFTDEMLDEMLILHKKMTRKNKMNTII